MKLTGIFIVLISISLAVYGWLNPASNSLSGDLRLSIQDKVDSLLTSSTVIKSAPAKVENSQWSNFELQTDPLSTNLKEPKLELLEYQPWVQESTDWVNSETSMPSAAYNISFKNFQKKIYLTLNQNSKNYHWNFKLDQTVFNLVPKVLLDCLDKKSSQSFLFWNKKNNSCKTLEDLKGEYSINPDKERIIALPLEKPLVFFIDLSPFPIKDFIAMIPDTESEWVLFDKSRWINTNQVLLAENTAVALKDGRWRNFDIDKENVTQASSGNEFKIKLLEKHNDAYPDLVFTPWNANRVIKDPNLQIEALKVKHGDETAWVTSRRPVIIGDHWLVLDKETEKLPFSLELEKIDFEYLNDKPILEKATAFIDVEMNGQLQKKQLKTGHSLSLEGYKVTWPKENVTDPHKAAIFLKVSSGRQPFWLIGGLVGILLGLGLIFTKKKS